MISLVNLSYHIIDRCLLKNVTLTLAEGVRMGLVGRNGCGKTTLFRLLLDQGVPDTGKIEKPKNLKIATVRQEMPAGDQTPLEFVLESDQERLSLLQALESCEDGAKMGDIYDRLIHIDAFGAEARAGKILDGLGFPYEAQNKPMSSFSGGYRMRVALAAALFQMPDLLLLDEPTNHLDLEATLWFQDFLKSYPNSFILISHEREFLNSCVEEILHLQGGELTRYKGNYDQFEKAYAMKKMSIESYNTKVAQQKAHWQSFVDRFKAQASKSRQAQSRMKAIEKLQSIDFTDEEGTFSLHLPKVDPLPSPIVKYEKISLAYHPDSIILNNLSGRLGFEDRIALLGANGNGKSTFSKFLAGRLEAISGTVERSSKLRVGYFHQHQLEDLIANDSAYEHAFRILKNSNETQVRAHLGRFGLSSEKSNISVKNLSGGEKVRLSFALLCATFPHILILDEPTNHLDIPMRQELIKAINQFEGAVILVSHDRHLLDHTVDQLWLVHDKAVKPFEGSLDDYRTFILTGKDPTKTNAKEVKKEKK